LAAKVVAVLAVMASCRSQGPASMSAGRSAPLIDPEVRHAAGRGRVRVLVEVRTPTPTVPEGALSSPGGVAGQRAAIASAQVTVLSRLPHGHYSLVHQYGTTPFLALEIDRDALTTLDAMGDIVARVVPDRIMTPASPR